MSAGWTHIPRSMFQNSAQLALQTLQRRDDGSAQDQTWPWGLHRTSPLRGVTCTLGPWVPSASIPTLPCPLPLCSSAQSWAESRPFTQCSVLRDATARGPGGLQTHMGSLAFSVHLKTSAPTLQTQHRPPGTPPDFIPARDMLPEACPPNRDDRRSLSAAMNPILATKPGQSPRQREPTLL